jgi:bifunctional polynucleotide phosphatase/kinase
MSIPDSVFYFEYLKDKMKGKEIIGLDIDGTIVSKSNILLPKVKDKLYKLVLEEYNIIFISNQKRRHIGDSKLKLKFEKISSQLEIPFIAFASREENEYRKPFTGILNLIPKELGEVKMFIGDAAGRFRDHSDDDLQFAKNAKIPFFTPEEFF